MEKKKKKKNNKKFVMLKYKHRWFVFKFYEKHVHKKYLIIGLWFNGRFLVECEPYIQSFKNLKYLYFGFRLLDGSSVLRMLQRHIQFVIVWIYILFCEYLEVRLTDKLDTNVFYFKHSRLLLVIACYFYYFSCDCHLFQYLFLIFVALWH